MSFYSTFQRMAHDWVQARRLAQTALLVSELPADIRKDIGWPGDAQGVCPGISRRQAVR